MFRDHTITVHCTIALVMGLQFRYQRAKLYREVAMGEKHHMTVSQGEGGKGSSCAVCVIISTFLLSEGKLSNLRFLLACLLGIYVCHYIYNQGFI